MTSSAPAPTPVARITHATSVRRLATGGGEKCSPAPLILALLFLLLAGCATVEPRKPAEPAAPSAATVKPGDARAATVLRQAENLQRQGDHARAAQLYQQLAEETISPIRQHFKLKAAENWLLAGQYTQAATTLEAVDQGVLDTEGHNDYTLLQVKLALARRDPGTGKHWLQQMIIDDSTPRRQHIAFLQALIRNYELAGESLPAIRERVNLDALLEAGPAKDANQIQLLHSLLLQPGERLQRLLEQTTSPVLRGWIELSLLRQQNRDPLRLAGELRQWRDQHPDHPAGKAAIASIAPPQDADSAPFELDQIALLLPLEGDFSKPAMAVQNGFLSAFYSNSDSPIRPRIRIYDTAADPDGIETLYQRAMDDGAKLVVGPLNKQVLERLAAAGRLPLPTLALNRLNENHGYIENLFQFGLSPEDEARQVAERAWLDGHNRSAILYPRGKWGERVAQAFAERWEQLGGTLINRTAYDAAKTDFSPAIKKLLNLEQSLQRRRELARLLGQPIQFEPRRRQDIDMVFMVAFPRQARLIPPQLKFHHASDLPIYTTSHSFSGIINPRADRDMNGVIIGDMPWTLNQQNPPPPRKLVFTTWPDQARQFSRLFALGVDAYNSLYYLNWLRANPQAHLSGVTGSLHMDSDNRLQRTLSWARFRAGRPRPLPNTPRL